MASVVLGTLWALWHLPWYFTSGVVVDEKVGLADIERLLYLLPLLILLAIPSRIIMTWLFNSAMGSVLIITLFHAGWDTTNTKIIPAFMPGLDKVFAENALVYAIFYAIALLLIVFTKGRLSYKPDHAAPPVEDAEDAPSSKAERRIPGSNMPSG
jgi:hypothetical protein